MRFLSKVFLILMCLGVMRPASAQTIPYVSTPCAGCTTPAQLQAAALSFFQQWAQKTPPGYVGVVAPAANTFCQGQTGASTIVVTSVAISGTFYGCYVHGRGNVTPETVLLATSTDPCYIATNVAHTLCSSGLTTNPPFAGTPKPTAPLPATTPPSGWGSTTAQIKANFAQNIAHDFATNPNINAVVTNIQPIMLARLSTEMAAKDPGSYTQSTLNYAAYNGLSAANLRMLQSAFGPTMVQAAVSAYSSSAVKAAYAALGLRAPLSFSQYSIGGGGLSLSFPADMYPYDLFLVQYFSANDTPTVALHKAAVYAQVRVKGFWDVLGKAGLIIMILDHVDPTWYTDMTDYFYYKSLSDPGEKYGEWGPFGPVYTVPDLTIAWPPYDPQLPDFPPIDSPPGDFCFDDADEGKCSP